MPEFAAPLWLLALLLLPGLLWLRRRAPRREARWRADLGVALRALAVTALVVALAGPLHGSAARHTDVVFLLDVSRSIDESAAARALELVRGALATRHADASMGLVVFGAEAAVELLLRRGATTLEAPSASVARDATDIGAALQVAIGAFEGAGQRRVVLLSDGRENLGNARAMAAAARAVGVEIMSVPLDAASAVDEVYAQGLRVPASVRVDEPYIIQANVHSARGGSAEVLLLRNGALLRDLQLQLQPGLNSVTVPEHNAAAGLYEYEVVVNSRADTIQENNRYQAFVRVRGAPRVLHVSAEGSATTALGEALRAQGLAVEQVPGGALPATLHRLVDYDLVILDNVSAFDLSLARMELLEEYVRDAGGGLMMVGGERSYSAGGYHDTPVERLLPVTMDVRSEVAIPSLAVTILLDRSGSMSTRSQGRERLDIAKQAALSALEVLNPLDRVGVLAFDASFEWVVAPTEVGNRRAIAAALRQLQSGGGTDLFVALAEAYRITGQQEAAVKHLIVLSDGLTDTLADFDQLMARIAADGITVSTVAFGADADRALLAHIARLGKGRHYYTDDPLNVPRIFVSETLVVARSLVVEGRITPRLREAGELLAGIDTAALPPLLGYQRTFARPTAQVLLDSGGEDPLLVTWRHGLGRSLAFTSDLGPRWAQDWLRWPEFSRFVGQAARWTMRRSGQEQLLPTFSWQGRDGRLVVDVLDADERYVNGLDLRATLVDAQRERRELRLQQIAPGRYATDFGVRATGRYYFTLTGTPSDPAAAAAPGGSADGAPAVSVGPRTFGLAVPYSAEFLEVGADLTLLEDLATATGGRLLPLSDASLQAIHAVDPAAVQGLRRHWWPWLLCALLALLAEVAVRKLHWPQRWQRAGSRAPPAPAADHDALLASIEATRQRHLQGLRDGSEFHLDDPAVRARLYRSGRR